MRKALMHGLGGLVDEAPDTGTTTTADQRPVTLTPPRISRDRPTPARRRPLTERLAKVNLLLHPAIRREFEILRAELATDDNRTEIQARLTHEAFSDLLVKHGKRRIAFEETS